MRTLLFGTFLFLFSYSLSAQFIEDFNGPSLQTQHPWETKSDRFFINPSGQLQFSSPEQKSGEDFLDVPTSYSPDMTWNFDIKLDFQTTTLNNLIIYVYSTDPDKNDPTIFYIQVGNNKKQISFYEWGKSKEPRIVGREDLLEQPSAFVRIVLTLEQNQTWTLYTCKEGESSFTKEGSYTQNLSHIRKGGKLNLTFRYVKARISSYYIDRIRVYNENVKLPEAPNPAPDEPDTENPEPSELPELTGLEPLSDTEIQFIFSSPVDIYGAVFSVSEIGEATRKTYGTTEAIVNTRFPKPMALGKVYTISWKGLKSREGKAIPEDSWVVRYESGEEEGEDPDPNQPKPTNPIHAGEIIFNEILPNPFTGGSEYIELYNRTEQALPLSGLSIATLKSDGSINTRYPLNSLASTIPPKGYILLTKKLSGVTSYYSIFNPEAMHEIKIPVLANTSSTLLLLRSEDDEVIDQLAYSSQWHTTKIKDGKGVALERIHPEGKTQDEANWASATAMAGYGTPGYQNSQDEEASPGPSTALEPLVHIESGNGELIHFKVDQPGYNYQMAFFNLSGQELHLSPKQKLCETEGTIRWEAEDFDKHSLPKGLCLLQIRLYPPKGKVQFFSKWIYNSY